MILKMSIHLKFILISKILKLNEDGLNGSFYKIFLKVLCCVNFIENQYFNDCFIRKKDCQFLTSDF